MRVCCNWAIQSVASREREREREIDREREGRTAIVMKRQEIKSWNSLHGIHLRYVLCLLNIIKQQQQQQ